MSKLEAKERTYSLEGYLETRYRLYRPANSEDLSLYDPGRPDDSDFGKDVKNVSFGNNLDVSRMSLAWYQHG